MGKRGRPSGRNAERDGEILAAYKGGLTLRECGKRWGLSFERIRQIIDALDPDCMRPPHISPSRRRA